MPRTSAGVRRFGRQAVRVASATRASASATTAAVAVARAVRVTSASSRALGGENVPPPHVTHRHHPGVLTSRRK
jgi:hypothetical protein